MTSLWNKLAHRLRQARHQRRQRKLPEIIWLHLVASLEESGRGVTSRPNLYQVVLPTEDYTLLQPNMKDLTKNLAHRLAAEAHQRGYSVSGQVGVDIVPDKVDSVLVKAVYKTESSSDSQADTTIVFHLPRKKQKSPLPPSRSLAVLSGPDRGSIFTLWGEKTLVGRSGTNHVILHDEGVSRVHLAISWSEDQESIEDLESLNGTWVNGRRLQGKMRLNVGDKIKLGSTTLEYRG